MQGKEELYWYWLCNLSGIGNKRIKRLLDVFKSPKTVFYVLPDMYSPGPHDNPE